MKAHVGVTSKQKVIHTVVARPANVDTAVLPDLLHVSLFGPIDRPSS
ncbi:MAG: hypothetical protein ACM3JB_25610 [Acidobacteriaceae bacterium]